MIVGLPFDHPERNATGLRTLRPLVTQMLAWSFNPPVW